MIPPSPPQEESTKIDKQAEVEEKQKRAAAVWTFDGHPRRFREIVSRRKKKKGGRERRNVSKCVGLFAFVAARPVDT